MVKSVQLRKEDCYCDLTEFYENVARKIPKLKYNTWLTKEHILRTKLLPYFKDKKMRDIRPTDIIQWQNEQISYRDEKGKTDEQIAAMLLGYGPKANLEDHGILEYRTEIEDGFIVCEEG